MIPIAIASSAWKARGWLVPLVALVLLVLLVLAGWAAWHYRAAALKAEQDLRATIQREKGEDRARRLGIPVVYQQPQAAVDEAGERAKKENPILRAQLAKAEKELGKLRLELVAHVETAGAPALVDVLRGTPLKLGGDLVEARDETGARTLHGLLWARLADGTLITEQPYSGKVTWAQQLADPTPGSAARRWRAGPLFGWSEDGWRLGGAVTTRVRVFGWEPEALGLVQVGPKSLGDGKKAFTGTVSAGLLF